MRPLGYAVLGCAQALILHPARHPSQQAGQPQKRTQAMSKVAIVAGYGPGIGAALSRRFGLEGYKLALLGLQQSQLDAAASELSQQGVQAKALAVDLADAAAVKAAVASSRQALGPIDLLLWNPAGPSASYLQATPDHTLDAFNVAVTGLMSAVQAAHPDLKAQQGAVLVTGAGTALESEAAAQLAVDWDATTLAVSKAAQRKLVHILNKGLAADGIYAAEVTVCGMVRGTPYDPDNKSALTPESTAEEFWQVLQARDPAVWFKIKSA